MKRGTAIALGILVALLGLYFVTKEEPATTVRTPWTIEKVSNLHRIEIVPPKTSGGSGEGEKAEKKKSDRPDLIALEKRDGEWWLTAPLEAPAAEDVGKKIEDVFGSDLRTDDLRFDPKKAGEYEVSTGAERTYVRRPGKKRIYRAQAAFGDFVRRDVSEFRSKEVFDAKKKKISRLEFRHRDGTTIVLKKSGNKWKLLRPDVEWELDTNEAESIAGALSSLSATGFAPDASLSGLNLDPPSATVKVTADGNTSELLVGRVKKNDQTTYYVKKPDKPFRYELSNYAGSNLYTTLTDIRSKTPREFDKKSITKIEFPGEDGVVVEKKNGSWKLVSPQRDKPLNESKLESKLETIASLTVKGFPDVGEREAGLGVGAEELVFEIGDKSQRILIGDVISKKNEDRYVKFADEDEIYSVTSYTVKKLRAEADELVGTSKKPTKARGMGKKGLMRKLKRKMRGGGVGR
ncbi:MAG: DUF4340 domain-containing protein [Bradymonadaceae bacterium]